MTATNYIWDFATDSYLMEKEDGGTTTAVYTNEPVQYGMLKSQRRDGATSYFGFDAQGSTRQLTDQSGEVTDEDTYSAFGETVVSVGIVNNSIRFKGQVGYYCDADTGNLYVRHRFLDAPIAMWLSRDPGDFEGATSYRYCNDNPTNSRDPSGMLPQDSGTCGQSLPNPQMTCAERFKPANGDKQKIDWTTIVDCFGKPPKDFAKCILNKLGASISDDLKLYLSQVLCCENNRTYPDPCRCGRSDPSSDTYGPCKDPMVINVNGKRQFTYQQCLRCCVFANCVIQATDALNIKVAPDVLKDVWKYRKRRRFLDDCNANCEKIPK